MGAEHSKPNQTVRNKKGIFRRKSKSNRHINVDHSESINKNRSGNLHVEKSLDPPLTVKENCITPVTVEKATKLPEEDKELNPQNSMPVNDNSRYNSGEKTESVSEGYNSSEVTVSVSEGSETTSLGENSPTCESPSRSTGGTEIIFKSSDVQSKPEPASPLQLENKFLFDEIHPNSKDATEITIKTPKVEEEIVFDESKSRGVESLNFKDGKESIIETPKVEEEVVVDETKYRCVDNGVDSCEVEAVASVTKSSEALVVEPTQKRALKKHNIVAWMITCIALIVFAIITAKNLGSSNRGHRVTHNYVEEAISIEEKVRSNQTKIRESPKPKQDSWIKDVQTIENEFNNQEERKFQNSKREMQPADEARKESVLAVEQVTDEQKNDEEEELKLKKAELKTVEKRQEDLMDTELSTIEEFEEDNNEVKITATVEKDHQNSALVAAQISKGNHEKSESMVGPKEQDEVTSKIIEENVDVSTPITDDNLLVWNKSTDETGKEFVVEQEGMELASNNIFLCHVPFSWTFSANCKQILKTKPLFDCQELIDSMFQ